MDHGKVLREGGIDQLLNLQGQNNVVEFSLKNPPERFPKVPAPCLFKLNWEPLASKGTLEISDITSGMRDFLGFLDEHQLKIESMHSRRMSLDDLFISLTGRHLNE
jgi:ABC-2 type transport system ATP-binding protein